MKLWVTIFLILFITGGAAASGGIVLAWARGQTTTPSALLSLVYGNFFGLYNWDVIGRGALDYYQNGGTVFSLFMMAVTVLMYGLVFNLLYKICYIIRDFGRDKTIISKTREKVYMGIVAFILVGLLSGGFAFFRALIGVFIKV